MTRVTSEENAGLHKKLLRNSLSYGVNGPPVDLVKAELERFHRCDGFFDGSGFVEDRIRLSSLCCERVANTRRSTVKGSPEYITVGGTFDCAIGTWLGDVRLDDTINSDL